MEIIYAPNLHCRASMIPRDLVFQSHCCVDSWCSGDSNPSLLSLGPELSNPAAAVAYPVPEQRWGWGRVGSGVQSGCSSHWEDREGRS